MSSSRWCRRSRDFVVVPFVHCDNSCAHSRAGVQSVNAGDTRSGQGEYAVATQADGTLVKSEDMPDADLVPSLLILPASSSSSQARSQPNPGQTPSEKGSCERTAGDQLARWQERCNEPCALRRLSSALFIGVSGLERIGNEPRGDEP